MSAAAGADPARDTIFALSSGRLPAAIAVMRVSGPAADTVLAATIGMLPPPRRATLRTVRDADGATIDHALVLRFPGPRTATGEDLAEFHFHGSRAVVAAATRTFAALGCREAEPGEFTRRALQSDRIDLADAEALADLLEAETENQHREALRRASGAMGRLAHGWAERVTGLAAAIERLIDHDEADDDPVPVLRAIGEARADLDTLLAAPAVGWRRDGVRVVLAGPPNAGKSSLFNHIVGSDAAIVSPVAGTTRDVNERVLTIDGIAFVLADTAGVHDTGDALEAEGIARAEAAIRDADIVVDLGNAAPDHPRRLAIAPKSDLGLVAGDRLATSSLTGVGVSTLLRRLVEIGRSIGQAEGVSIDERHRARLSDARAALAEAETAFDLVIAAEHVRTAMRYLAMLDGFAGLEATLDALFARFCVGK